MCVSFLCPARGRIEKITEEITDGEAKKKKYMKITKKEKRRGEERIVFHWRLYFDAMMATVGHPITVATATLTIGNIPGKCD